MSSSTTMTSPTGSTGTVPNSDTFNKSASDVTRTPGCLVLQKSNSSFVPWNNPENLVSQETEGQVHVVINVYVLTVLFCVSTPANVVNMLVFWRQGLKERINLCLFSLALTDFITVFTYFWSYLDDMVAEYTPSAPSPKTLKFIINNFLLVITAFGYVSWFLCLVIAVERCVCIVFPLRASSLISTRVMLTMIVTAAVVIVGCFAVVTVRIRVACVVDPVSGAVTDTIIASQFYLDNADLVNWMRGVGFGLILPGLCLFGVTSATTITIRQLRVVSRWRELATSGNSVKSSSTPLNTTSTTTHSSSASVSFASTIRNLLPSSRSDETSSSSATSSAKSNETSSTSATTSASSVSARELALTRMLIVISVFFIVFTTPVFVLHAVVLIVPEMRLGEKYHNLHMILVRIMNLCFYLNATVNFFVYCITGSRFCKTLCAFFPCCRRARKNTFRAAGQH